MTDPTTVKEISYVVALCCLWYTLSSANNVVGKTVLNNFPYPMTVTIVQLLSITVYSGPLFALWGIRPQIDVSWRYYFKLIIPLSMGKFCASVSSHISIWKVPVSYSHTVKSTMPLFTVVLSRLIMGEKQTFKVYVSLAPIILGVFIATLTELSFDSIGLISALVATLGFSLQNIFSKKALHDTGMHHLRLLHVLARLALLFFIPVWLIFDVRKIAKDENLFKDVDAGFVLFLLFVDGAFNVAQNVLAFSVLSLVSPLTYSVCNATKRISVIAISLIFLQNPVSIFNVLGMMLAVVGVLCYNKAKYDANQEMKKAASQYDSKQNGDSLFNFHDNALLDGFPLVSKDYNMNGFVRNGDVSMKNGKSNPV